MSIRSNETLRSPNLPSKGQEEEEGLQEVPIITGLWVSTLLLPAVAEPRQGLLLDALQLREPQLVEDLVDASFGCYLERAEIGAELQG